MRAAKRELLSASEPNCAPTRLVTLTPDGTPLVACLMVPAPTFPTVPGWLHCTGTLTPHHPVLEL